MAKRSLIRTAALGVTVSVLVAIVAIVAIIAVSGGAQAGDAKTVGHLRDHCSKAGVVLKRKGNLDETYAVGECLGRIEGFVAGLRAFAGKGAPLCLPAGLSAEQGRAVFMKWAKANPQQWDRPWARGIAAALAEAYPCRPKRR